MWRWGQNIPIAYQKFANNNFGKSFMTHVCVSPNGPLVLLKACPEVESNNLQYNFSGCSSFFETKANATLTIFPNSELNNKCTLMLLTNLAEPEWIPVNCKMRLAFDLLCESRAENTSSTNYVANKEVCFVWQFQHDDKCFLFVWHRAKQRFLNLTNLCVTHKMKGTNDEIIVGVLGAVSVSFPPILFVHQHGCLVKKLTLTKFLNVNDYQTKMINVSIAEGFLICASKKANLFIGINLFECEHGVHISAQLLCDGRIDCQNNKADEANCSSRRTLNESHSTQRTGKLQSHCSDLMYTLADKSCAMYDQTDIKNHVSTNLPAKQLFSNCKNGPKVNILFQNDLFANCASEADDEPILSSLLKHHLYFPCKVSSQLPCKEGHTKCYNLTSICIYILNVYEFLYPCRNGGHLENCHSFQCNMMFKCHFSYCVPWSYVCDGKQDCPSGNDERFENICGNMFLCADMYKCRRTIQCVHLGDVCDDTKDCAFGDDEYSCELNHMTCPTGCHCLLFGIKCQDITLGSTFYHQHYPHIYLSVSFSNIVPLATMMAKFPLLVYLTLIESRIKDICSTIQSDKVLSADISFNQLKVISNLCFALPVKLKSLNLSHNHIYTLQRKAFFNLTSIHILSLSSNPLSNISADFFLKIPNIKLLSMRNISTHHFNADSFLQFEMVMIDATDFHVCCVVPSQANCTSEVPWHTPCNSLMPDVNTKVTYILTALVITSGNGLSVVLHYFLSESAKSFLLTVYFLSLSNTLSALYLGIVIFADMHFAETFVFLEHFWRSSSGCFAAFNIILFFVLLSHFANVFLPSLRMMVVISPMETKFKTASFTQKCLSCLFVFFLFYSVLVTLFVKYFYGEIPTTLCVPFFDPPNASIIVTVTTWCLVSTQLLTPSAGVVTHILLVYHLKKSQKCIQASKSENDGNTFLIIQLVSISVCHVLSCSSAVAIYIAAMYTSRYPVKLVTWTTVVVTPINAVVIPAIFLGTLVRQSFKSKTKKHTSLANRVVNMCLFPPGSPQLFAATSKQN